MNIESLLTTKVIEAVSECYGAEAGDLHVQLQPTRKEFAGDLTVVVFPFTRFSKKSPVFSRATSTFSTTCSPFSSFTAMVLNANLLYFLV